MNKPDLITQEILREWFDYHPDGYFIYRKDGHKRKNRIGEKVTQSGLTSKGYKRINVTNVRMREHRAIFLWHHGFLPEAIDHINQIKTDNRIENLRQANYSENLCNRGATKASKTGHKGVFAKRNKFEVKVMKDYVSHSFGVYECLDEAIKAHEKAIRILHGDFASQG